MAIKAIIDKLEDVEEAFRPLYKEKNGKFEIEVEGMKTQGDVDRLQLALTKERTDHKETKKKFDVFGDKKPDEVLALLDRIPELEAAAAGKLDDTKISELADKRVLAKVGPLERKIKTLETQASEKDGKITEFTQREVTRTIHDSIRESVGKSQGFQGAALEDALLFGERHLTLNDEGKVVTKDSVGVTPGVDSTVWLSEMQARKPHWWGDTKGGGASGNKGGGGGAGPNPFARETWNLTEQGRILKESPSRAEGLAKSAGTTVGGGMPLPKK